MRVVSIGLKRYQCIAAPLALEGSTRSYRGAMTPVCPTCGSPGVPLIFGLTDWHVGQAAQDGRLALGGCIVPSAQPPNWECQQHHRWRHGHEEDQQALIVSVLRTYGYRDVVEGQ